MTGGWRPMRAADLPAVVAIADEVHGVFTEPLAVYAERLALYPDGCRIFEAESAVAGFLVTHPWHRDAAPKIGAMLGALPAGTASYYLHDIALLPAARGTGAGAAAMAFVLEQAAAADCDETMLVAVHGADSYWSAQGFDYAEPGRDGPYGPGSHLMRRTL
ncbi:MAG TPA: GNAT family N-acetyltransferase [Sphingopyxis sp.]|nr:GNAT family N-acetyltransferase [Sphingopyxis sp.]HMP45743.1 GNAT family N-acetyltransferase [Sphingopyxis sp.]HMQ18263.1 GNAT family N-acetyltransferase [Sphingopyxis sp.]